MSQDDDTQTAFKDKKDDNMRIQDDTHWAFGDPDEKDRKMGIKDTHWAFGDPDEKDRNLRSKDDPDVRDEFLQAFRDMVGEGLPRGPSGKDPRCRGKTPRPCLMHIMFGVSSNTQRIWMQPLWT